LGGLGLFELVTIIPQTKGRLNAPFRDLSPLTS
jgi:hypothetical protein